MTAGRGVGGSEGDETARGHPAPQQKLNVDDGRYQVGGRLVGQRHDGDVGVLGRFDDAALDDPAGVETSPHLIKYME